MRSIVLPEMRVVYPQLIRNQITEIQPMTRGRRMREVTVKKDKLLEILKTNRKTHMEDYIAAEKGYYEELVERHEAALVIAKQGPECDTPVPNIHLQSPTDHTPEYDKIIGMLEMDIDDEVVLREDEYSSFVDNDWDWKRNWDVSNTMYMQKAGRRR